MIKNGFWWLLGILCLVILNNLFLYAIQWLDLGTGRLYLMGRYCEIDQESGWWIPTNRMFLIMAILRVLFLFALLSLSHFRPKPFSPPVILLLMGGLTYEALSIFLRLMDEFWPTSIIQYFFSSQYLWPLYLPLWVKALWAMGILFIQFLLLKKIKTSSSQ